MNVLHCPQNEVKQFWDIVQLPVHLILQTLGESSVPKAVLKSGGECDSIQKSLWILCKKFKFSTTSAFQIEPFKKFARSDEQPNDYEISSNHISDGNTCLLSSFCCYLEGDDN